MEAEEDFFNIPFPPSVSKDNQMREMPHDHVHVHAKCDYGTISPSWSLRAGGSEGGGLRLGMERTQVAAGALRDGF